MSTQHSVKRLIALVNRLRPHAPEDIADAERNLWGEIARLARHPDERETLSQDLALLLAMPHQTAFYAETGIHSALGFGLELTQRIGERLLPKEPNEHLLLDVLQHIFHDPDDPLWVQDVSDQVWLELLGTLWTHTNGPALAAMQNVLESLRVLSYRIAGTALDRELLRAEPSLEQHASPFLAQNSLLIPHLPQPGETSQGLQTDTVQAIGVQLEQCITLLARTRRKARENGISIRLSYLLARLEQLIARMQSLLILTSTPAKAHQAVILLKTLLNATRTSRQIKPYLGENVSLLARNITDHASRHGEHYIAEDRSAWWGMAKSAAGGGIIIACMAMIKIQLSALHLPPLTEGIAYGLNYGLGFVLIHLLGFTVATKQPAMTAAAIAATLEDARPRDLHRLGDLVQNVIRTQFIAVLGNIGLAFPVACLIAFAWPELFGVAAASHDKAIHLLRDIDPVHSGTLFFAAVAGIGLFLSGLVSGYFDNQARYHALAPRIAAAPALRWLGARRAKKLGHYLDAHYGAILGNLFFGMYLGLVGVLTLLTGLPVDIRHVAFASANLGTTIPLLDQETFVALAPWAIAGVIGIALVNLAVSFSLALYVALKSRGLGMGAALQLAALIGKRFAQRPLDFVKPPAASGKHPLSDH